MKFSYSFLFVLWLSVGFAFPVFSQRMTKLNTHGNGTLFAQFGYNRSGYLPTKVGVEAGNYNYSLEKVALTDNFDEKKMANYFSSSSPQFSVKLGCFVADFWAITASWDRYNTFFKEGQEGVRLDGVFAPNSHSVLAGSVNNEINLFRKDFHIAQKSGMNVFSVGVQRNDMLGRTKRAEFAIHTLYGLRIGGIHTNVDYSFDDKTTQNISSFGGFAIMADIGVRLDFYQHVYLQLGLNGGLLHQGKIKLSKEGDVIGKQSISFLSPTLSLGFSIFANSKNNCASCPSW